MSAGTTTSPPRLFEQLRVFAPVISIDEKDLEIISSTPETNSKDGSELSEKDLEKVAGGVEPINTLKRPRPLPLDPVNG